jgi:imidazole glycerol-phosphate synthase subunit HisH
MGNLRSVAKALATAGAVVEVTGDRSAIDKSDALCVPGQGIFGKCMTAVTEEKLDGLIQDWISDSRAYLGICLGMQILFEGSDEDTATRGLGVFEGRASKLPDSVRVPHIGWNEVKDTYFYFDHSYAVHPKDESIVTGWCDHGDRFAAWIQSGNVTGVQFHPEKSSSAGIELLARWLDEA